MSLSPTQKKHVRSVISSYCLAAEGAQVRWNYSKQRPFHGYGVDPTWRHVNDCSGYVSLAFQWASVHAKAWMHDPLDEGYSGFGNTGSQYEYSRAHCTAAPAGKYLVGDWVIYGWSHDTVHTSVCRKAGSDTTAIFSSNGNERAPQPTKLHYHPDPVLGVWRHPALS